MFPCSHIYFSLTRSSSAPLAQTLGAAFPDSASVGAVAWSDFHIWENLDAFSEHLAGDPTLESFGVGVREHLELDDRSHHSFAGGGGYAYVNQTPELVDAVALFGLDEGRTRELAHNFIEIAVDFYLRSKHPFVVDTLNRSLHSAELPVCAEAVAGWLKRDRDEMLSRLHEFVDLFDAPSRTLDGTVAFSVALLDRSNDSTFEGALHNVNDPTIRRALALSLEIVEADFLEVLTP